MYTEGFEGVGLDVWPEFEMWIWVKKPLLMIFRVSGESWYINILGQPGAKRSFQSEARKVLIDNRENNIAFFYWKDDVNGWK